MRGASSWLVQEGFSDAVLTQRRLTDRATELYQTLQEAAELGLLDRQPEDAPAVARFKREAAALLAEIELAQEGV